MTQVTGSNSCTRKPYRVSVYSQPTGPREAADTVEIPGGAKSGLTDASSNVIQSSDIVSSSVTFKNTLYSTNMLVVLEVINQDKIRTGWIKKVIFREDKVLFLVSSKVCTRTTMRFFQSLKVVGVVQLICVDSIKSYKPLIPRGNEAFLPFFSMAN